MHSPLVCRFDKYMLYKHVLLSIQPEAIKSIMAHYPYEISICDDPDENKNDSVGWQIHVDSYQQI